MPAAASTSRLDRPGAAGNDTMLCGLETAEEVKSNRFRTGRPAWVLGLIAAMLPLIVPGSTHAQPVPGYPDQVRAFDPREIQMLPKYCIYTQDFRERVPGGNDPVKIEQWSATMGEMFHHMHHYCYGLMKANRGLYLVRDSLSRKYYLRDAVIEYDYVLQHAKPDFILYPEVLNRKAEALLRLGESAQAVELLEQAVQIKPDYWAPYAGLSDHYKESGDLKKAREILQSGLAAAPDAVGLKRRLDELNAEEAKRHSGPQAKTSKGEK